MPAYNHTRGDSVLTPCPTCVKEQILDFCNNWRNSLLKNSPAYKLSEEQFGQLVALNTLIYYVDNLKTEDP
jgi:hypothetical protein